MFSNANRKHWVIDSHCMNHQSRALSIFLVLCLALFADAALGQSLSLIRNSGSGFSIVAAAPPDTPYVLQESANLHLWVDLTDGVSGQFTNQSADAGVTKRFFQLTAWTEPAPDIIIVLLGDSTVAEGSGWGQGIYGYFKPNVRVVNLAAPWHSTKVFLESDQKVTMLKIKPNYVLAQFGSVDAFGSEGFSDTIEEYQANLKTIVQMIRDFNGTPILLTPSAAKAWDAYGKVIPFVPDHCAVVKQVAAELQTPLLDLNKLCIDLFQQLGPSGAAYMLYTVIPGDVIHYSPEGAKTISGLVVNALPDNFGPYLTNILDFLPTP